MPSVIVTKVIKPGRFQGQRAANILSGAVRKAGNDIRKDFQKTTKTWDHKVTFTVEYQARPDPIALVGTDDDIYTIVNNGAPGHYISPVDADALVYQVNYEAKTIPGQIDSQPGGKWGDVTVRPWVGHFGFPGRKFDEVLQKKWESIFLRRMEDAMRRARDATNHAI